MNFQAQLDMRVCAFVAIVKTPLVSAHPIIITFYSQLIHAPYILGTELAFPPLQPWIEHAHSYDINTTNTTLGLEVLTLFTEPLLFFFFFFSCF